MPADDQITTWLTILTLNVMVMSSILLEMLEKDLYRTIDNTKTEVMKKNGEV